MTFTVPGTISRFIQENKELLLGEIFHAVSGSLLHWCQRHRNFTPGIVMILQTSGDQLNYHVHIHLLITCGGLRKEKEWIALKPARRKESRNGKKYHPAFPPQTICKGFKTLLYRALRRTYRIEGFKIPDEYLDGASNFEGFNKLLRAWWKVEWNIDVSDPLCNSGEILEYIARYIKKPPISNRRIIEFDEDIVKFLARDRQSKNKKRKEIITMTVEYFLMCFLEHVPLERFPLIRWYGIFSNRKKKRLMPVVQELIPGKPPVEESTAHEKAVDLWRRLHKENCGTDPLRCPVCGSELQLAAVFFPNQLTSLGISFEGIPQFLMN